MRAVSSYDLQGVENVAHLFVLDYMNIETVEFTASGTKLPLVQTQGVISIQAE